MLRLDPRHATSLLSAEFGTRRALALHHGARQGAAGCFWADQASDPRTVVLVHEAEVGTGGRRILYAAGRVQPAVDWLAGLDGPSTLLAPASWSSALSSRLDHLRRGSVCVRFRADDLDPPRYEPRLPLQRLRPPDGPAFQRLVPRWAWSSWGSARSCLEQGAAFGVAHREELIACAWIQESDDELDALGVFTAEPYRRLGLVRELGRCLVDHVSHERRRCPVWVTGPENLPSLAAAASLGFSLQGDEALLLWGDGPSCGMGATPGPE